MMYPALYDNWDLSLLVEKIHASRISSAKLFKSLADSALSY